MVEPAQAPAAGPFQVTRWYRALTPNRADTEAAEIAAATEALGGWRPGPAGSRWPGEAKKAY